MDKIKNVPIVVIKSGQKKRIQVTNKAIFKTDLIYESKAGDFLNGERKKTAIINTLNRITNVSRTIVTYSDQTSVETANSDAIVKLIGQDNYEVLLSALCSVISQELRVRGILALLTSPVKTKEVSTQTETALLVENSCQTKESYVNILFSKPKRVKRRTIAPYVVKEPKVNRIVINPDDFKDTESNDFPSNQSWRSIETTSTLLRNPLAIVDKHTRKLSEMAVDTNVSLPNTLEGDDKRKLELYQSYVDWTSCLVRDEDGNFPLHTVVLDNDVKALWRQCQVLQRKGQSVDIPGEADWTALKLAILKDHSQCTEVLLNFHPDLLLADEKNQICLHYASEAPSKHLQLILNYCKTKARKIMSEDEDLWNEHFSEYYSDDDFQHYLLNHMLNYCDSAGNTALNIASKLGNYDNVRLLLEAEPSTVNFCMPTSGDTALHSAVVAAITEIKDGGNQTTIDNYKKTIEILIKNDANPSISNTSAVSVNDILTESNLPELSMLIANTMAGKRLQCTAKKFNNYMLVKNKNGDIKLAEITKSKIDFQKSKKTDTLIDKKIDSKTVIDNVLANNIVYTSKGRDVKNIKITGKRKKDVETRVDVKKIKL